MLLIIIAVTTVHGLKRLSVEQTKKLCYFDDVDNQKDTVDLTI